ncbi:MAG TPA: glycosyl hydrolase [Actinomycetota bacterium]
MIATLVAAVLGTLISTSPASAAGCLRWGALPPSSPGDVSELEALEGAVGRPVDYLGYYQGWAARDAFDTTRAGAAVARGATPVVAWEPWDWTGGVNQPEFRLARVIAGDHDDYIRAWAQDAKAFGGRIILRFAYEMNGDWMPWSESVNGNRPGEYVRAWRHVHRIFDQVGARNVRWIWAPNVVSPAFTPLKRLYPGDRWVDLVGIDGYNWGTTQSSWGSTWQSFDRIFRPTIRKLRRITSKRILITEIASTEHGGDKAAWTRKTLRAMGRYPFIVGFMWFNYDKETDWRIQSSASSLRSFRKALSHHRFSCRLRLKARSRSVRRGAPAKLVVRVRPYGGERAHVVLSRGGKKVRARWTGPSPSKLVFEVPARRAARYVARLRGPQPRMRSNPVRVRVR